MLDLQGKNIIVLTGMMGAGKTTIGNKLADKLGFYFIDSDQEIEDREGDSISEIFKKKGEKYFRDIEKDVVTKILSRDEQIVLSLGGGAFMNEEIRNLIKSRAISVWLYADIDTLLHRISAKSNRPLLNNVDKRATVSDLIIKRYPTYKTSDIHIDTSRENYELLIRNIIKKINELFKDKVEKDVVRVDLGEKSYDIVIGSGVISELSSQIKKIQNYNKIIILTDQNVAKHHLENLKNSLKPLSAEVDQIIVSAGEKAKSFANLENVLEQILQIGVDRKSLLIAFGGGVVGDLGGFAASIVLRGIDFIQVPTTLLASVDSSVGGKTAINSHYGKNLIGSFYQPRLVLCDIDFLETLPVRDFASGYAEVVKYGLICDENFFDFLNSNLNQIKDRDKLILQKIITKSCQIKADVVGRDERENSLRAILNFGHTFGHVFEAKTNYSDALYHGEAVAIGMVMAAKMSANLGLLNRDLILVIEKHLQKIGLPIDLSKIKDKSWNINELVSSLYKDKKTEGKSLTFILLEDIGKCVIKKGIGEKDFINVIAKEI